MGQLFKQKKATKRFYNSVEDYRDLKNSIDKAEREGREEGRKDEKMKMLVRGFEKGIAVELLAELTDLTIEEVLEIKKELGL